MYLIDMSATSDLLRLGFCARDAEYCSAFWTSIYILVVDLYLYICYCKMNRLSDQ